MAPCYLDRTFCPFYKDCFKGEFCYTALTEEIQRRADLFGLPVCQFLEKPECFLEK